MVMMILMLLLFIRRRHGAVGVGVALGVVGGRRHSCNSIFTTLVAIDNARDSCIWVENRLEGHTVTAMANLSPCLLLFVVIVR